MAKPIKRIGILTSGGDGPGMNAAVRAVVRYGMHHGLEVMGIMRGYQGLLESDIVQLNHRSVSNVINKGGTILKTARSKEFATDEGKLKAAESKPASSPQWGMTPEQVQEFNRIAVKTEAMEDNVEMWGIKGLTISGYADPTYIYNRNQKRAGFQFLNQQGDGYFYDTSYIGSASIDCVLTVSAMDLTVSPSSATSPVKSVNLPS